MDRAEELRQWFNIAGDDLRSAEYLATMRYPRPDAIISFHCQQSAEKYLKGFLFQNGIVPPRTHDLLELLKICGSMDASFSSVFDQCNFLNKFSVTPRYPDEIAITPDDVSRALQYARDIQEFIAKTTNPR